MGSVIRSSEIINQKFDNSFINILSSKSISSSGTISYSKVYGFIKIIINLLKKLFRFKPDLCCFALSTSGPAFYRDFILISVLKLFRIKIVYHLHNKGISKSSLRYLNYCLYKKVFSNSHVILLSTHLYSDLNKYVPKNKIHICFNGLEDQHNEVYQKSNNAVVKFLFLSNLFESKGIYDLLEASKNLVKKGFDFKCIIIGSEGDINHSDLIKKTTAEGLFNFVEVKGPQYGIVKFAFFNSSDVFIFPTYYDKECMPLVTIEAMMFSLPVISTFEGGILDVVEDGVTGFLVPQRDVDLLGDRMEQLILNPDLREKMGKAGRKRYEEKFTQEIFEKRLCEILNTVLSKPI